MWPLLQFLGILDAIFTSLRIKFIGNFCHNTLRITLFLQRCYTESYACKTDPGHLEMMAS